MTQGHLNDMEECPLCNLIMESELTEVDWKEGYFEILWKCPSDDPIPSRMMHAHDIHFHKRYKIGVEIQP